MNKTNNQKQKTYQRGLHAETVAVWFLRLKGYKILVRRYKTKVGEIDIIARRGNKIIFTEVKARPSIDIALESITPSMRRRIEKTALTYMAQNDINNCDVQFDVIAVLPFNWHNLAKGRLFIHHLDKAWMTGA